MAHFTWYYYHNSIFSFMFLLGSDIANSLDCWSILKCYYFLVNLGDLDTIDQEQIQIEILYLSYYGEQNI